MVFEFSVLDGFQWLRRFVSGARFSALVLLLVLVLELELELERSFASANMLLTTWAKSRRIHGRI